MMRRVCVAEIVDLVFSCILASIEFSHFLLSNFQFGKKNSHALNKTFDLTGASREVLDLISPCRWGMSSTTCTGLLAI